MNMQFSIHISVPGRNPPAKFFVPSARAVIAGVWSEPDRDLLTIDRSALAAALPYRFRKAWERGAVFWHDSATRWNGARFIGHAPYADLYDSRGRWLGTITAIPCAGGPPRRMVAADIMSMSDTAAHWAWRR